MRPADARRSIFGFAPEKELAWTRPLCVANSGTVVTTDIKTFGRGVIRLGRQRFNVSNLRTSSVS